jgi:hypothetical protein
MTDQATTGSPATDCYAAWTDVPPSKPGRYVWTMDGRYAVYRVRPWTPTDPRLTCDGSMPVCEYDGWWLGPLPEPEPFIRLPRVSDTRIASRPKRQQIPQSAVRILMGVDAGVDGSECGPRHLHNEQCHTLGCLNQTGGRVHRSVREKP